LLTSGIGTNRRSFRISLVPAIEGAADIAAEGWSALDRRL